MNRENTLGDKISRRGAAAADAPQCAARRPVDGMLAGGSKIATARKQLERLVVARERPARFARRSRLRPGCRRTRRARRRRSAASCGSPRRAIRRPLGRARAAAGLRGTDPRPSARRAGVDVQHFAPFVEERRRPRRAIRARRRRRARARRRAAAPAAPHRCARRPSRPQCLVRQRIYDITSWRTSSRPAVCQPLMDVTARNKRDFPAE